METCEEQFTIIRQHQKKPPVNVLDIAKAFNLSVYANDEWKKTISGILMKDFDGYYIIVNANHYVTRQRFTVAHEIAHFILHKDDIGDGIEGNGLYRSHLSVRKETQANRLAANILMPWNLINSEIEKGELKSAKKMADIFSVHINAIAIRLEVPLDE